MSPEQKKLTHKLGKNTKFRGGTKTKSDVSKKRPLKSMVKRGHLTGGSGKV